ncbi:MAG: RnfABCDGE type electron transport complex subunit B [Eubacterium sp.]|nr:RnfABCDGE type electron transport complex subunit B [Eubacterium sp.]
MVQDVLFATLMIGGIGLFVGIFLGIASKIFFVPVDEKEAEINEALPGANCGACGFSGCAALAAAIAKGNAPVNACVVGQQPVADKIAAIMGGSADEAEKLVAFVRCVGDCEKTTETYDYTGTKKCMMAKFAPTGGPKSCRFGCTGFGDCVEACEFDAIHIQNGIAVVDKEKCVDCKKCMKACPKGLIIEVPYKAKVHIGCVNPERGKPVISSCGVGCITCNKCAKGCPKQCISMDKGYPVIDYANCINCRKCMRECPRNCIV